MLHPDYADSAAVDSWCERLLARADAVEFTAQAKTFEPPRGPWPRHSTGEYIEFTGKGFEPFCAWWQRAISGGPTGLLVHVPGYGAELSSHPELVSRGFNVLHVAPQGYGTPERMNEAKQRGGNWPVLPDTVESLGRRGYVDWLCDALVAVRWALGQSQVQQGRLAFFGTSQGGGTALLLASLMRDRSVKAVAADLPFLTNFPMVYAMADKGAYFLAFDALERLRKSAPENVPAAWRALGFIDTLSHAHRLTMPTLLTAGTADNVCPPATIRSLFEALPATRAYIELAGCGHLYTREFLLMSAAWFGTYV
jgi:cephalosporin-C deacetylase-like acetyl esterase